ncbi:hypothetical protein [Winogradskya humida]|uniref:Restriction endonuclease n=1 Tax=Winogradskya humida TaxID=113566 RepID=A0ABQ4A2P8_9ACTN|nr:hypothetical protein [Actinoplanes humidus]GIE25130.1 hypothetical protein Ahu01nite_082320 [Actinoplanes humidus]
MTLTTELADRESPASRFLHDSFPARDALVAVWNAQIQRLPPVATVPDGGLRAAIGGAIEWAIGLDLADTVPYADVFDMVAHEEAARVLQNAGLQHVIGSSVNGELGEWQRPASWTPSAPASELLRDAWMLCQYSGILRRLRHPDREQFRQSYHLWLAMFGSQGPGPDVREALETLWHTYVTRGQPSMARLGGPRVIRPVFDEAFAIGDLILGGALVDVKTYPEPAPSMGAFVDQLLGYVLCDVEDHFNLRSIGIYLAWQGKLLHLPLDIALSLASGQTNFDLHTARRIFQQRIVPAVERSRFYKYGSSTPTRDQQ